MTTHRFTLAPYKGTNTRHTCPSCGRRREFTRYTDTETNTELAPHVGKCNRAINCGYHYTPRQYFEENHIVQRDNYTLHNTHRIKPVVTPASYIDAEIFKQSLQGYDNNHFVAYLSALFGKDEAAQLISRYYIGTSAHWQGATVFWQVDMAHKIRGGKIMLYDPLSGKRVKEPYNHISWVHSALELKDYHLHQCLFGEHLLHGNNKTAAVVESEKTAIIASRYMPEYIWLAAGSLTNLTPR